MNSLERSLLTLIICSLAGLFLREGAYQQDLAAFPGDMVVSVSGSVVRPGVIRLPAGARAVHAITLCGGLAASADREAVPLARPLRDGEHLVVARRAVEPTQPEVPPSAPADPSSWTPLPGSRSKLETSIEASERRSSPRPRRTRVGVRKKTERASLPEAPLDLNRASVEELDTLPGIGPVTARRIVEARAKAAGGTFGSLEELRAIRGIKAKTFLRLKPYLKIEGS